MIQRKHLSAIFAVGVATVICAAVIGLATWLVRKVAHRNEYHGRPLSAWLTEVNSGNREAKEEALNVFVEAGSAAVPMLIKALNAPDATPASRVQAASALAVLGGKAHSATSALITAYGDSDASVRAAVLNALANVSTDPSLLVAAYIRALGDPSPSLRYTAAKRLQKMPSLIKPAIPALQKACSDSDKKVREAAIGALESINVPVPAADEAVPALPGK